MSNLNVAVIDELKGCIDCEDVILNTHQAAEFIDVSMGNLYVMVQRGQVPVKRLGRMLLFSRNDLTEWLKTRKQAQDG